MTDPLPDGSIVPLAECVREGNPLQTELACCLACGAVLARDDQVAEIHRALHVLYVQVVESNGLDEPGLATMSHLLDQPSLDVTAPLLTADPWRGDPADEAEVENDRFRCWEEGFTAGLKAANGKPAPNPYQWHHVVKK